MNEYLHTALLLSLYLAPWAPLCLFSLSVLGTVLHLTDEVLSDGGPIWDNFGAIVGVRLPWTVGFTLFTVALGVVLAGIAAGGYLLEWDWCLSLLLGLRIGDVCISHLGYYALGWSDPNPGFNTIALYAVEAAVLAAWPAVWCWPALLVGLTFFALVLPALAIAGELVPSWRRHQ